MLSQSCPITYIWFIFFNWNILILTGCFEIISSALNLQLTPKHFLYDRYLMEVKSVKKIKRSPSLHHFFLLVGINLNIDSIKKFGCISLMYMYPFYEVS